jgi:hypothetical protein
MIRRETTPDLIDRISNMPEVHPFMQRHGHALDWSAVAAADQCIILSNGDDAAMIFEKTDERDWQVTTCYAPTCRGKRAVETGLAMKEWMRPHADMVFGSIPNEYRHALWFYRKMGGIEVPEVESGGSVYVAQPNETLLKMRML